MQHDIDFRINAGTKQVDGATISYDAINILDHEDDVIDTVLCVSTDDAQAYAFAMQQQGWKLVGDDKAERNDQSEVEPQFFAFPTNDETLVIVRCDQPGHAIAREHEFEGGDWEVLEACEGGIFRLAKRS